jgi:Plasmid pRiA4b ORF-3-like protein
LLVRNQVAVAPPHVLGLVPHPFVDQALVNALRGAVLAKLCRSTCQPFVPKGGKRFRFTYEYDFGDSWSHEIAFEGSRPAIRQSDTFSTHRESVDEARIDRLLERHGSENRDLRAFEPRVIERARGCRFRNQPLYLGTEVLDLAGTG